MSTYKVTGVTPVALADDAETSDDKPVAAAIRRLVELSLKADVAIDVITVHHDEDGAHVTLHGSEGFYE